MKSQLRILDYQLPKKGIETQLVNPMKYCSIIWEIFVEKSVCLDIWNTGVYYSGQVHVWVSES